MGMFNHIQLLEQIHHSITNKRTGKPKVFAARLNISESTLFRIIDELRDQGAEVYFDRNRSTYYYKNEVEIKVLIRITASEIYVKGGKNSNYCDLLSFLTVSPANLVL